MEGLLQKKRTRSRFQRGGSVRRHFLLRGHALEARRSPGDARPRETVDLRRVTRAGRGLSSGGGGAVGGDGRSFFVQTDSRTLDLRAATREDAAAWVRLLRPFDGAAGRDAAEPLAAPSVSARAVVAAVAFLRGALAAPSEASGLFREAGDVTQARELVLAMYGADPKALRGGVAGASSRVGVTDERKGAAHRIYVARIRAMWPSGGPDADPSRVPEVPDGAQPHVVADALHMLLGNLPETLLTDALYERLVDRAGGPMDAAAAAELVRALPDTNYEVLHHLCALAHDLCADPGRSGLNAGNLALVLGDVLCRHGEDAPSATASASLVALFTIAVDSFHALFGARAPRWPCEVAGAAAAAPVAGPSESELSLIAHEERAVAAAAADDDDAAADDDAGHGWKVSGEEDPHVSPPQTPPGAAARGTAVAATSGSHTHEPRHESKEGDEEEDEKEEEAAPEVEGPRTATVEDGPLPILCQLYDGGEARTPALLPVVAKEGASEARALALLQRVRKDAGFGTLADSGRRVVRSARPRRVEAEGWPGGEGVLRAAPLFAPAASLSLHADAVREHYTRRGEPAAAYLY